MSQVKPKEVFHNTAYSVQLPYIAGHSLKRKRKLELFSEFIENPGPAANAGLCWQTKIKSFNTPNNS